MLECPQGSIFRPLIILNTIRTLNCNVRLLADYTTLCVVEENSAVAATILNDNLIYVHNWADQWLTVLAPQELGQWLYRENVINIFIPAC